MNQVGRISSAALVEVNILHRRCSAGPKTLTRTFSRQGLIRRFHTQSPSPSPSIWSIIASIADKWSYAHTRAREELRAKASRLKDELLQTANDGEAIARVLGEKGASFYSNHSYGSAFLELLVLLRPWPQLGLEVFNWRRNQTDFTIPMTSEEYAKGITIAGRMKNLDLADELFAEAANKRIKSTSTYNALMGAYMLNGFPAKCQLLFWDLKRDASCCPTIVTYNILISVFGRLMLVDHMEATFRESMPDGETAGLCITVRWSCMRRRSAWLKWRMSLMRWRIIIFFAQKRHFGYCTRPTHHAVKSIKLSK